ncbi:hypothetical protein [Streptomyces sp. NPDC056361]|uniref:hypothetical protein n=1 Tax=Streptomyces sp. NPDC056361 TaxID=3345795 RepID=UPI0035E21125
MIGTIRQEQAAGATVVAPAGRQELPRVAGLLLAVVAVLYVATPVMQASVTPLVESDLGLTPGQQAAAQVVGLTLSIAVLAAAGRGTCGAGGRYWPGRWSGWVPAGCSSRRRSARGCTCWGG